MISSLKTKINYNYESTIWKHWELLEDFDISILVFEEQEYKTDLSFFFYKEFKEVFQLSRQAQT